MNKSKGRVIFRLDDIQDYWITNAQKAIMEVFANNSPVLPLSIGIIGKDFGADQSFVQFVQALIAGMGSKGEVACHGWEHVDFSHYTYDEQVDFFRKFKENIFPLFSEKQINSFIPPENGFDENTIKAMKNAGYTILSAQCTPDWCTHPADLSSTPIYEPTAASTGPWQGGCEKR